MHFLIFFCLVNLVNLAYITEMLRLFLTMHAIYVSTKFSMHYYTFNYLITILRFNIFVLSSPLIEVQSQIYCISVVPT